jgi:Fe-S-cluster containining protein
LLGLESALLKIIPIARYDCTQCPGYCCSYDRIAITDRDLKRLAKHFNLNLEDAERRFTRFFEPGERIVRHRKDPVYGSICRFFDTDQRRCSIYEARPTVCRDYPHGSKCGYYEFLKFERRHQGDPDFIPSA